MKLNKLVLKFVSISFSILVMLLVVIGLIELGSFCYDFGYRVFTEGPVDEKPGTDVTVDVTADMSEYQIGKLLKKEGLIRDANLFYVQLRNVSVSWKVKNRNLHVKYIHDSERDDGDHGGGMTEIRKAPRAPTEQIWIHRTEHLRMIPGRMIAR